MTGRTLKGKSILLALLPSLLFWSAAPVRSEPDQYLSSLSGSLRFPKKRLPIAVYIDETAGDTGYLPQYKELLMSCFMQWQAALKDKVPELSFVFVDASKKDQAAILCTWTKNRQSMTSDKEDGRANLVIDEEGIKSVTLTLLTLAPPGTKELSPNYLSRVALHEIGHALGLSGHSPDPADIMFGSITVSDRPVALSSRDIATLSLLYSGLDKDKAPVVVNPETMAQTAGGRALMLSNESNLAMKAGRFDEALKKMEEAYKLDPSNALIARNLGGIYANFASISMMARNPVLSESYFKKAIATLEKDVANKPVLSQVQRAYGSLLMMTGRASEAEAMLKKSNSK